MPLLFSARTVAERALRKIGSYSINDTGADPEELREALFWLDMIVAELAGTQKLFWLVQNEIAITLDATTASYDVEAEMGANAPDNGILSFSHAVLRDSSGNDSPLEMLSRSEYEAIPDKDESGLPWGVYIDHLDPITMKVLGVPTVTGYSIVLTTVSYPPDMTLRVGGQSTGFASEWNSFLVTATAAAAGDGPVRRLNVGEIDRWKKQAETSRLNIMGFANRERRGMRSRVTQGHGV